MELIGKWMEKDVDQETITSYMMLPVRSPEEIDVIIKHHESYTEAQKKLELYSEAQKASETENAGDEHTGISIN